MRGEPFVFSSLGGGVNTEAAPYAVDETQARDALNVQTTPMGAVRKRNGFTTIAQIPVATPQALFPFVSGGTKVLVSFEDDGTNTPLHSVTSAGVITSIKGSLTLTPGNPVDGVQALASGGQGPLYMLNGVDAPFQWTGSGNATTWSASAGAVPNGKYVVYHDNRVVIAGVQTSEATKSTLYASAIADPRNWTTPDAVTNQFNPQDGEYITALGQVGPYLLVFKPRKTFVVFDSDALGYREISTTIGCVAHRSVVETDQGTFFLDADRNINVTDGSSIEKISTPVETLLNQIPAAAIDNAAAIYYDQRYYISFSTSAENDIILEFDTRNASWWIHKIQLDASTQTGVNAWAVLDPAGENTLYASGANATTRRIFHAFKPNTYRDREGESGSEQVYQSYWTAGWNTFGQPHLRKHCREIRADAKGDYSVSTARSFDPSFENEETVIWESVESATRFGGTGTFGGSGTFGDSAEPQERRFPTPGIARAWSVRFLNETSTLWELYSYTFQITMRRD